MGVLPSNLLGSRGLWLMEVHKGRKIQEEKERKGREQDGTNSKRSCGVLCAPAFLIKATQNPRLSELKESHKRPSASGLLFYG
jgi:hypothetical protein